MRIFIGVVGFWFWGSIFEVMRKAIGFDESVSIAGGASGAIAKDASEVIEFRECHAII
jgi:hypothetical protein